MLQEIDTQIISISPAAVQAVQNIIDQRQLEGYALRVFVSGGGCCGVQFGMALDNVVRDNDKSFNTQGLKIVVDDQSIEYLRGASIEFVNDPVRGAGFVVNSPSASQGGSCACGSGAKSEGEGCGCGGGSCGCGGH
ncbi:MAG: iron-sulfur cluster assembly accessory protein [Anaerolineales bacterium]